MKNSDRIDLITEEMNLERGQDIYSGHWGAKEAGLNFISNVLDDEDNAIDLIERKSNKWDPVAAVKVVVGNTSFNSDERMVKLTKELDYLKQDKKDFIVSCLEKRKESRKTATCKKCKKHTKIEDISYSTQCPHCKNTFFYLSQTEAKRIPILDKRISNKNKEIESRKRALKVDDKSINKLIKEYNELKSTINKELNNVDKKVEKLEFVTCNHCKSRINIKHIKSWNHSLKKFKNERGGIECPVCEINDLINTQTSSKRIGQFKDRLIEMDKMIAEKTGTFWVVGGWCPA